MFPRHWLLLEVSPQPSAMMVVCAEFKVVGTLPDTGTKEGLQSVERSLPDHSAGHYQPCTQPVWLRLSGLTWGP